RTRSIRMLDLEAVTAGVCDPLDLDALYDVLEVPSADDRQRHQAREVHEDVAGTILELGQLRRRDDGRESAVEVEEERGQRRLLPRNLLDEVEGGRQAC